jgi:hypothetical protein
MLEPGNQLRGQAGHNSVHNQQPAIYATDGNIMSMLKVEEEKIRDVSLDLSISCNELSIGPNIDGCHDLGCSPPVHTRQTGNICCRVDI